jgi:nucleotide-binding universal stress UspA family protein
LRSAGVDALGQVGPATGSTARELLNIAREFDSTVIVVADRGSQVSDLLLGSVAHRIVHLAACSVLLAR